MVKSMTGYGRARETRNKRDITVEVRSVNNRYLDCTVKLPRAYVFAEDAIKGRVQKAVSRGKVDVFVTIDSSAADVSVVKVNEPLARSYYEALLQLKETFGLSGEVTPVELSRCPDVLSVTKAEEDLEMLAEDICQVTDAALAAYNRMRSVEGVKLAEDIAGRADTIERTVTRVEAQSPQTVSAYRERLESKMREVLASTTIDEARILTETAIFADKIAVDEETVRLHSHLSQLRDMLRGDEPVGRKLDFLIQEINRECNTIGSKCSDLTITQDVVNMHQLSQGVLEHFRAYVADMDASRAQVDDTNRKTIELLEAMGKTSGQQALYLAKLQEYQAALTAASQQYTAWTDRFLASAQEQTRITGKEMDRVVGEMHEGSRTLSGAYEQFTKQTQENLARTTALFDESISSSIHQLNETLDSMREMTRSMPQLLSQSRDRYAEQVDQFVTALVRLQKAMEKLSQTADGKE